MQWLEKQIREGMNARTYALVGLLLAVLVWIWSLDDKSRSLRSRAATSAGSAPPVAVLASFTERGGPASPTPPGWGDDPFDRRFRPGRESGTGSPSGATRASAGTGLHLQGVMNGPRGRTALVNGEVVREGDRIGGREVLQIGARSVLLLDHGTVITMTLKGEGS